MPAWVRCSCATPAHGPALPWSRSTLDGSDAADQVRASSASSAIRRRPDGKPRWLLFNKPTFAAGRPRAHAERVVEELGWTAPWFVVSGLAREGTREVMLKVQAFLDEQTRDAADAADAAGADAARGDAAGEVG